MTGKLLVDRVLALKSSSQSKLRFQLLRASLSHHFTMTPPSPLPSASRTSLVDIVCKAGVQKPATNPVHGIQLWTAWIHSTPPLGSVNQSETAVPVDGASNANVKRKKLKGKRAVVRWLKYFRWKKKKDYERMTSEEKILYKLTKARRKEERLITALKKIEPSESSEATHDPEILTPEEHFFFLKMGIKCKNYVPVGRRGIYQGVILNMHLHWKKHQTLQVIVKTFPPDEVKEIATELARLSGGIVLDIHQGNTIIMYRGKNYVQPPTEIMSPRVTLPRKKALDKSKYKDALRGVRRQIPRLEQELDLLRVQGKVKPRNQANAVDHEADEARIADTENESLSSGPLEGSSKLKQLLDDAKETYNDDSDTDDEMISDSEDLSDIFETDSGTEMDEEKDERPLYLDQFEKFPVQDDGEPEDFEEYLKKASGDSKGGDSPTFDEVDRMFIRAASLLRKNRRHN
ncbi:unnamed protein product [Linum tenue]|uniref:CRM domain-containing protein n=1 Tax=Linum tenue TaxID=586396 RepID=A0AAV0RYG3_9ROSI|nr:unnamed protein product [Linum tenue]